MTLYIVLIYIAMTVTLIWLMQLFIIYLLQIKDGNVAKNGQNLSKIAMFRIFKYLHYGPSMMPLGKTAKGGYRSLRGLSKAYFPGRAPKTPCKFPSGFKYISKTFLSFMSDWMLATKSLDIAYKNVILEIHWPHYVLKRIYMSFNANSWDIRKLVTKTIKV